MPNRRNMMNPSAAVELVSLFRYQLSMCNLTGDELCLVITDTAFNPVYSDACLGAALELGADTYKQILPFNHALPKKSMGSAWQEADLIVFMTTYRLHYHEQMAKALERGSRAIMVVSPLEVLNRLTAHPDVIRRTKAGADLLGKANKISIKSDAGTDLVMERGSRPALAHYGVADIPGHLDFWGAGMVETAQMEESVEGTLVLNIGDANFSFGRYMESPVEITFRESRIIDIKGGLDAMLLKNFLEAYNDENALKAGHTSWGTDRRADWHALVRAITPETGVAGIDIEAHYGNIQIEIGSNNDINFKGKNVTMAHLGLCCLDSSLWLDDLQVIDHGKFIPQELQ